MKADQVKQIRRRPKFALIYTFSYSVSGALGSTVGEGSDMCERREGHVPVATVRRFLIKEKHEH